MTTKSQSLKLMAETGMEDMYNQPMRISDAASSLRKKIDKNERPYQHEIYSRNNTLVDEWYETVLTKLADKNGMIPAMRVADCWNYFYNGNQIAKSRKYIKYFPDVNHEKIKFWINLISKGSIAELYEVGITTILVGWDMISAGIRYHFADEAWEKVFSKSTDPLVWDKMCNDNPHLMHNRILPYGLTEELVKSMAEKVMALRTCDIKPPGA